MGSHVIQDISYSKDYLLCVCEWSGKIKDFLDHKKTAPPTTKHYVSDQKLSRKFSLRGIYE